MHIVERHCQASFDGNECGNHSALHFICKLIQVGHFRLLMQDQLKEVLRFYIRVSTRHLLLILQFQRVNHGKTYSVDAFRRGVRELHPHEVARVIECLGTHRRNQEQ